MEKNKMEDNSPITLDGEESEFSNNNNVKENPSKPYPDKSPEIKKSQDSYTSIFLIACIAGIVMGLVLEVILVVNRSYTSDLYEEKPIYWVYAKHSDQSTKNKSNVLKHMHLVLQRIGYQEGTSEMPWTLLWSYTSLPIHVNLRNLKENQFVSHIPGTGHITLKVDLATTASEYIPKAFALPKSTDKFLKYAAENPNALFVQKQNTHRHVYLRNVSEINMTDKTTFIQEYIQKPFLVDGHKFDLGVYVVLKSVNPLRVYWYKGDVIFRYCPEKYYPFDPTIVGKYVVGDNYLPTWKVDPLEHIFTAQGNNMKESFDFYVRSMGKDPTDMWEDVLKAITEVFVKKEHLIINAFKDYKSTENFFEMMRFDLIVDEDLKVYLLEANMSPNLIANSKPQNQLLYEQVLYNLFSLIGVSRINVTDRDWRERKAAKEMVTTDKNIAVFGKECSTICQDNCGALELCQLCKPCLSDKMKKTLLTAHGEFLHKGDFRRLIPRTMVPNEDIASLTENFKYLSPNNKLLNLWYQGKCNQDITWCVG